MKDIKLNMNGEKDTFIDLNKSVDNHNTLAQQCLVLSVTLQNSDKIFPTKGTQLQAGVNNVNIIDNNYSQHMSNIAALDILNFLDQNTTYKQEDVQVTDIDMGVLNLTQYGEKVSFYQKVYFSDGTFTDDVIFI